MVLTRGGRGSEILKIWKTSYVHAPSGDAGEVWRGQRKIAPKSAEKDGSDDSTVQVDDLMEVTPGLCMYEAYDRMGDKEFVLEAVSWPGVQMPRSLNTWSAWLASDN